ncbi:MAG: TIGR04283 family arsenosugar biosynthesis glycosyltransferase [Pirellulales bacterium]
MNSYTLRAADRLLVFTRYPEPGRTKTRLIPALGPAGAADLHAALASKALRAVDELAPRRPVDLEVQFAGGDAAAMGERFGAARRYAPQQGESLGERLERAIAESFRSGARRVVVIGVDCPDLDAGRLQMAFESLDDADVVLGPALDGGYYLIGLTRPQPELFQGIDWGTDQVLRQTLAQAARRSLHVQQLPPLGDVDHPEDLIACRRHPADFHPPLPTPHAGLLSIIIPTLNEERSLASTLAPLAAVENVELIVADGGSRDATVDIAARFGARVIVAGARGRGRQMNAGAALARGETLLFLHADTRLPDGFRATLDSLLTPSVAAGAFPLRIDDARRPYRWLERAINWRSRVRQLPYGDQALFLRSETFFQLNGFAPWPLMEDYDLSRRLRRLGRIRIADQPVVTSARRWQKRGLIRTTLLNQGLVAAFRLGVSPQRLARWYYGRRAE